MNMQENSLSHTRRHLLPWVIAIAMFIDTLDSTIVGVAIPNIASSFQIDPINMKMALTSYLLSLAVFIPISGWLADRFGAKKMFIVAMIIFTLSSIACAFSFNLLFLIFFRLTQGFGGALMMPVGRLIILRTYSRDAYSKVMGTVVVPGLIGPALGPTIGGLILHVSSWHWIFLMNVPFGLVGVVLAYILIPAEGKAIEAPCFNWFGFILFSVGLALLTMAMALLGDNFSWYKASILLGLLASFLLTTYIRRSLNEPHPLLDLTLFKEKSFTIAMAISFFARIGIGAMPFLLPLLLQLLWEKTALYSGIVFLFLAAGMMSSRLLISQKLLYRYGYRRLLMTSIFLLTLFSMALSWFTTPRSPILLGALIFCIGLFATQIYMSIGSLYPLDLKQTQFSQGTSIASTIQQFAAGCGIAFAAITLHLVAILTGKPLFSAIVFFWTFIGLNIMTLVSLLFAAQLTPDIGKRVVKPVLFMKKWRPIMISIQAKIQAYNYFIDAKQFFNSRMRSVKK